MHVCSNCSDWSGQHCEAGHHQMSTMFTPMTLLRFSFLPCAATLHAKACFLHVFLFFIWDQIRTCDREAEKSKPTGWMSGHELPPYMPGTNC